MMGDTVVQITWIVLDLKFVKCDGCESVLHHSQKALAEVEQQLLPLQQEQQAHNIEHVQQKGLG